MKSWAQKQKGFTLVELLIVIVVIAILAAISVVAYNGIQNRANDTAVRNDLSNIAKKYELFYVDNSSYPDTVTELNSLGVRVSQSAYQIDNSIRTSNIVPCHGNNAQNYAIVAVSKSGKQLFVTNGGSVQEYTGASQWLGDSFATMCTSVRAGTAIVPGGVGHYNNVWRQWTGVN